jgi:uncharacterized protein with NRDE domain
MCLIAFNWVEHPVYKLVLVANRDEYFDRPTDSLRRWESGMYAGRDRKAGGTWLGIHPNGRFAALTNYRDIPNEREGKRSRGDLIPGFINSPLTVSGYLDLLQTEKHQYNGFSLIVVEGTEMWYISNYQSEAIQVTPGVHGLSNALLDTPWAKVQRAKKNLEGLISAEFVGLDALGGLLQSRDYAPEAMLPSTGLDRQLERSVSAQFIRVEDYYGTVNTTALLWKYSGEVEILEQRYIPDSEKTLASFRMEPTMVN